MRVSSREESDDEPPTEDEEEEERFDGDLYTPPKLGHGVSSALRRPRSGSDKPEGQPRAGADD